MAKRISGKIVYQDLGTGFWGIIADNGKEYRPVNMPEQLKRKGAQVSVLIKKTTNQVSMFMWGEAVEIVGFHTLMP